MKQLKKFTSVRKACCKPMSFWHRALAELQGHSAARVLGVMVLLVLILCVSSTAMARVTRITIDQKQSPAYGGKSFGQVGRYEILNGHAYGEINPNDPHNQIIQDINLAPTNSRGLVEYVATFTLLKPMDLSKVNGVMLYAVPNRGNRISTDTFSVKGESGNEFLMKRGYIVLHSGWQGDLPQRAGTESINVPIARNLDGSNVTGPALVRFSDMSAGTNTLSLPIGHAAANLDTAQATLTKRATETGSVIPIAPTEWAFSDSTHSQFPGQPDSTRISIKGGFDPEYLYELTYTAKDPLVLGIGLAATRDIVSFFRHETNNSSNTINPVDGRVKYVIAQGVSQAGNFVKTFINLGFNEDEAGHIVWDGANPHIAARQLPINFRFASPGGAANLYEPGSEGTLWWGNYYDLTRDQLTTSLLDRSQASKTSPKIFETFGSAEFWGLRMSAGLVGRKADWDIPLPSNVRRYYFPGTTHGGGSGGFSDEVPAVAKKYELAPNPNSQAETMRALLVALTDWVTNDVPPPASVYPHLDDGQLVRPNHSAMGFPLIPGKPLPDNLINPFYDYDFGSQFNYHDLSGVITVQPPIIKGVLPVLVPKVDEDGNETSGIPSALHQTPLGTYVGWNVLASGFYKGHNAGFVGGFIPFAETKAERQAKNDPRLSLEERYHDHDSYVAELKKAVQRLSAEHFLLSEDAERLIQQAEKSDVLKP